MCKAPCCKSQKHYLADAYRSIIISAMQRCLNVESLSTISFQLFMVFNIDCGGEGGGGRARSNFLTK